jgi:hypothetical protein
MGHSLIDAFSRRQATFEAQQNQRAKILNVIEQRWPNYDKLTSCDKYFDRWLDFSCIECHGRMELSCKYIESEYTLYCTECNHSVTVYIVVSSRMGDEDVATMLFSKYLDELMERELGAIHGRR